MNQHPIAVYGAGGFAREVAWLAQSIEGVEVACFVDDSPTLHGQALNGVPVMGLEEARSRFPRASIVGGVGSPSVREKMMQRAAAVGFAFGSLVHPTVARSRWIEMGAGAVICAYNILTTNIKLGTHVQINLGCTIGHDAVLGDYATLAPGVHISGNVHLGRRSYIGTGAVIINGTPDKPIVIGDDAIVGAGACVVKDVEPASTVAGVPAKRLK
jgi:sugar O-acyltransferase (sialic acid O-acetyltransferase NeuD family)